jgi:tetratricopeptide (TPR) repeat protein
MNSTHRFTLRAATLALAGCGLIGSGALVPQHVLAGDDRAAAVIADPLLQPGERACAPGTTGQPPVLRRLIAARTETSPFQPVPAKPAAGEVPLFEDLGRLTFKVGTAVPRAQAYFDQGIRLAYGFNHAEAQRAFQAAQRLDPGCAMCFWGEALVLGPNINAPMDPAANAPALAAIARAKQLAGGASARERALIDALDKRYSADPKAERPALDAAFADAMQAVAKRFPADDFVQVLQAEAIMDTQPWDYWEAAGAKPKGRTPELVAALETVLRRNPSHAGAIHLYIHVMESSTAPEKALPHARRLPALVPGSGHLVHMPAHVYIRLGMYKESLAANLKAIEVDEKYFARSPSDPMYRSAYYPHNVHFVMVSAQMGGDGKTALEAGAKLDGVLGVEVVRAIAALQPIKAAPYTTHAQFSDATTVLALPAPDPGLALVRAMYHYARAVAFASRRDEKGARAEMEALRRIEEKSDFKPFAEWAVPAKEIVQTARLVAQGRLADAMGDLEGAARAYEEAVFIEDSLAYMEPSYWYYPVRQSLGSVRLRQGRLDEAQKAFRDSLGRVRGNGWALAGLAETYRLKGEGKSEKAARDAYARAWLGPKAPEVGRL